jgi:hypothetical protein
MAHIAPHRRRRPRVCSPRGPTSDCWALPPQHPAVGRLAPGDWRFDHNNNNTSSNNNNNHNGNGNGNGNSNSNNNNNGNNNRKEEEEKKIIIICMLYDIIIRRRRIKTKKQPFALGPGTNVLSLEMTSFSEVTCEAKFVEVH